MTTSHFVYFSWLFLTKVIASAGLGVTACPLIGLDDVAGLPAVRGDPAAGLDLFQLDAVVLAGLRVTCAGMWRTSRARMPPYVLAETGEDAVRRQRRNTFGSIFRVVACGTQTSWFTLGIGIFGSSSRVLPLGGRRRSSGQGSYSSSALIDFGRSESSKTKVESSSSTVMLLTSRVGRCGCASFSPTRILLEEGVLVFDRDAGRPSWR